MSVLAERIERFIASRLADASGVKVDQVSRIHGGSSQETFRFRARWTAGQCTEERNLILRRAPESGLVKAERDIEWTVYSALCDQEVPVPRVYWYEEDPAWLDRSFFIMDLVEGKPGDFLAAQPYGGKEEQVARKFWQDLGRLAALDHRALGLESLRNGDCADGFWWRELDHWEAILDAGEAVIEPVVRGAVRWLRRNPPPEPQKPAIVHGDYRSGNFLALPDGTISAILDWEMTHVGDPLEDIAWALNPMWSMGRHLADDEAFSIWESASGLDFDPAALEWWRLFATVKACGIWTTAEASFQHGTSREMIIALTGMRAGSFHRKEMLQRMRDRGAMG